MKPVPHGEPYAGKLHVRFDEGAGVPDNKGRPALLYTPSKADIAATGELNDLARRLGIVFLDHLLIGADKNDEFLSFAEFTGLA